MEAILLGSSKNMGRAPFLLDTLAAPANWLCVLKALAKRFMRTSDFLLDSFYQEC